MVTIGLVFLLMFAVPSTSFAGPVDHKVVKVLDGKTVRIGSEDYRLVGFDTPETYRAKCSQERALGESAKKRVVEIVARGGLDLTEVPCSCPSDAIGTRRCNRGRLCAKLTAFGQDVGEMLRREGLSRVFLCGPHSCPRRRGWC